MGVREAWLPTEVPLGPGIQGFIGAHPVEVGNTVWTTFDSSPRSTDTPERLKVTSGRQEQRQVNPHRTGPGAALLGWTIC